MDREKKYEKIYTHADTGGPPRITNEQPPMSDQVLELEDRAENEIFAGSEKLHDGIKSILAAMAALDYHEPGLADAHLEAALDSTGAASHHYSAGLKLVEEGQVVPSESFRTPLRLTDLSEVLHNWQSSELLTNSTLAEKTYADPMVALREVDSSDRIAALADGVEEVQRRLRNLGPTGDMNENELKAHLTDLASTVADALFSSRVVLPTTPSETSSGEAQSVRN